MPDPTQIWGTYGESSGGGGTGGPTPSTPDPSGTYAQCNDVEPDAPPDPDGRVLWNSVKSCGGDTPSVEWVPIDDPTYPLNSVYRVTDLTGGDLSGEQCVLVTDDRSLSATVPDADFPQSTIICGGYPDCDECNATCYKITDCLTAAVTYSNSVALAGVTGFRSVIGGRCYTVAVEADKSNCCPDTDTDVSPAGSYADCAACDDAINPSPAPCLCPFAIGGDEGPSSLTVELTIKYYTCSDESWVLECTGTGSVTLTQHPTNLCLWLDVSEEGQPIICDGESGIETIVESLTLDTSEDPNCFWSISIDAGGCLGAGCTWIKENSGDPTGSYSAYTSPAPFLFCSCCSPDPASCDDSGLSVCTVQITSLSVS